ncbi:MAG: serine hydrolase [Asgard group archaeon]|nr:serine hydrolase [Asgard group archaeon]
MKSNKRILQSIIAIFIIISLILPHYSANCIENGYTDFLINDWINYGWENKRPLRQRVNPLNVQNMFHYIEQEKLDITHIFVLKNGFNVVEKNFKINLWGSNSYDVGFIVKTITASAIGLAIENNQVNLSQKVLDFFPEINQSELDPCVMNITVDHLLSMRAGFQKSDNLSFKGDVYQRILKRPIVNEPGAVFSYDKYLYTLLAYIGGDYIDLFLDALSIIVEIMAVTFQGYSLGFDGMTMSMNSLVKIGYMYLNNGFWEGKEIITNDWIKKSLTKHSTINDTLSYGYSWLINERIGCYSTGGFSNNQLIIIPKENAVIVIISYEYEESYLDNYYIIENILFNTKADFILGLAFGIPIIMIILVSIITYTIKRKKY